MIKLTHANFKIPVWVAADKIAAMYKSPTDGATHIISMGAIIPVQESPEAITALVVNKPIKGEEK